ncbi:sulfotransferase domain-containing protein [Halalkalibacter lacteus]|uniref:sulfotransferase domain-containing protein n=1 Tax=Halalkalibacter lacteus TaxID=3090663 RepID=UPI002FC86EC4
MINLYRIPKIFINSVPKSGTNLLLQIIEGIPNLKRVQEKDLFHIKQGAFVTAHLPFDKDTLYKLKQQEIKQLFIYRDLRDVTVSLRHFINNKFHDHPLHRVFKTRLVSKDEQLNALICGIDLVDEEKNNKWGLLHYPGVYQELRSIYEWAKVTSICSLKFEDLIDEKSVDKVVLSIIDYLFEDSNETQLDKFHLLKLMKENNDPKKSWTFRSGKIGSWKDEFTMEHKETFKKITGDFLIDFEYEKDNNW